MAPGRLAAQVVLVALVTQIAMSVSGVRSELSREGLYPQSVNAASAQGSAAKTPAAPAASRAKKAAAQAPARKTAAGKATSYAFETVNSRGEPARWNTCATIPVVVDTVGAPAGVIADLRTALALVNVATGLRLTITATANRALTAYDSDNPTTPVLVGFTPPVWPIQGERSRVAARTPPNIFIVVDFPHPFGPSSPTTCPAPTVRGSPNTTVRVPKVRVGFDSANPAAGWRLGSGRTSVPSVGGRVRWQREARGWPANRTGTAKARVTVAVPGAGACPDWRSRHRSSGRAARRRR